MHKLLVKMVGIVKALLLPQQVETSFLCPLIEDADEYGMLRSND